MNAMSALALSAGGMALGLAIDCLSTPPPLLASLCVASGSLVARATLHWTLMPFAHTLMLAAALAAMTGDKRGVLSVVAMFAGMALGSELGPRVSAALGIAPFAGLVAAMLLGMAGGMAAAAWVSPRGSSPGAPPPSTARARTS